MYSCVYIIKRTYFSGHHTYIWNIPFSILVLYFQFWYTLYISFKYTLHIRIWLRIRIHALHMTAHIRHHLHIRIYTFIFGTRLIFGYISYFMFGYTLHIRYSLHVRHYLHIRRHFIFGYTLHTFGTFFVFNTLYIRILHIRIHECPIESLPQRPVHIIRRPVRLVRMDKSALRVDTSRQYWTFLRRFGGAVQNWSGNSLPGAARPHGAGP